MKSILVCLFVLVSLHDSLLAADWDPKDETFDPSIRSVVIGDRSWLGDPSPFFHVGLQRTGYTHVMPTAWEGFDPSVQISLIVPLKPGEASPQSSGMLMMNRSQTLEFIKAVGSGWKAGDSKGNNSQSDDKVRPNGSEQETSSKSNEKSEKTKRVPIKSAFQDADWGMRFETIDGKRMLQLDNKNKEKVNTYRFSIHASKKLTGALQHSLTQLKKNAEPAK